MTTLHGSCGGSTYTADITRSNPGIKVHAGSRQTHKASDLGSSRARRQAESLNSILRCLQNVGRKTTARAPLVAFTGPASHARSRRSTQQPQINGQRAARPTWRGKPPPQCTQAFKKKGGKKKTATKKKKEINTARGGHQRRQTTPPPPTTRTVLTTRLAGTGTLTVWYDWLKRTSCCWPSTAPL